MADSNVKAVIFDMDGVVFNTEAVWADGYQYTNGIMGSNVSEDYRKTMCGRTADKIISEMTKDFPGLDAVKYRQITEQYVDDKLNNGEFEFRDGFIELANKLKKNGYKIALATSGKKARAEKMFKIKGYDVHKVFDTCVFGEDVGLHAKPDPMVYRLCSSRFGFDEKNCMVVEDAINGVQGAHDGGFIPCMAVDLIEPNDYCKQVCTYIVRNLRDIEKILGI